MLVKSDRYYFEQRKSDQGGIEIEVAPSLPLDYPSRENQTKVGLKSQFLCITCMTGYRRKSDQGGIEILLVSRCSHVKNRENQTKVGLKFTCASFASIADITRKSDQGGIEITSSRPPKAACRCEKIRPRWD
ncbi:MAG: hypothetical protein OD815_000097 [Candidatus Alkanophagales archaeon MCA70_species_2]|nr:hypothetical protein [Candidatus Alkanophaga liquidiphilum]